MVDNVFVLGGNNILFYGVELVVNSRPCGSAISIDTITTSKLLSLDNFSENKRTIVIVPHAHLTIVNAFISLRKVLVVSDSIGTDTLETLIYCNDVYDILLEAKMHDKSSCLTSRERKICVYINEGVNNRQLAKLLQCSEKNISYVKRVIMNKWKCKNVIEFYKLIFAFFSLDPVCQM